MYWNKKGPENTDETANIAIARANELSLGHIVVASSTGRTAEKFIGCGLEIVCVTHHVGYLGPGKDEMDAATRERLTKAGVKILTTTHLLAGVDRALRNKFSGVYPAEIMAQTLRIFGQGIKVCVEVASMALDAGLIPHGVDIVSVGGTGTGADTAAVIAPAHSNQFFDTKVREIICKPRN
ncbi:MAG: pyruvate kinase alpha/beta domain-containing protein [Desulfocucumaceae bacterium]